MTTSYTLTGDLGNVIGTDAKALVIFVDTNLPRATALVDTDANKVLLAGPVRIDGSTFSVELIATNSTGINITDGSLRYVIRAEYVDSENTRHPWASPYFSLTANADLAEKVEDEYLPPTFASDAIAQVQALVDQASEITGLTGEDAAMAAIAGNPASQFAIQQATTIGTAITDADVPGQVAAGIAADVPDMINAAVPAAADAALRESVQGLVAWDRMWLADDVPLSDGDPINEWAPTIGTGNLAQTVSATQPFLVEHKLGNRRAVSFAGGYSGRPQYLSLDLLAALPQPYSVYVVANVARGSASQRVVTGRTSTGTVTHLLSVSSGGFWYQAFPAVVVSDIGANSQITRAASVANGSASKLRINGTDRTTNPSTADLDTIVVGAAVDSGGVLSVAGETNIGFIGIKAGAFTAQELIDLDAWAADYYGIAAEPDRQNDMWSWWTRPRAVHYRNRTYAATTTAPSTDNTVLIFDGDSREPRRVVVGQSGGTADDHNNGALILAPGKPAVMIYTRHSSEALFRWRKGTLPIEQDPDLATLAAATEQTEASPSGLVAYSVANVHGDDIHLLHREYDSTSTDWWWTYAKSTDWADTWATHVNLLTHPDQFYTAAKVAGDKLRIAVSSHPVNFDPPDQNIYYGEIDLLTGNVTDATGAVLGNTNGTNLPLAISDLTLVASPTATYRTWVYDVSDGPVPEVAWVEFDENNVNTTGAYKHSVYRSSAWTTQGIVAAGKRFSEINPEPYLGGVQYPSGSAGGRLYVSREASGVWYIECYDTTDDGATWTKRILSASTGASLARGWPVESLEGGSPHEVMVNQVSRFVAFQEMDSTIRPAP